jgi:uncharacterized protein YcbK (DUF882 family)
MSPRFSSRIVFVAAFLCLFTLVPFREHAATAESSVASVQEYRLRLYHTHTNRRIDVVYRVGDRYVPRVLDQLNGFLADHRTGDVRKYDPRVFDLLYKLTVAAGRPSAEIDVVCGYRTPQSNGFLRRTTVGVAEHSRHMLGQAIDIRVPGVSTLALRNLALELQVGGVGYYPKSQFVHVDVGPVRRW